MPFIPLRFVSLSSEGHLPVQEDGTFKTGKVGESVTEEEGKEAARLCGLQLIATMKKELGDLDKVTRIVKVGGFVQSADSFHMQPAILNGCSDLFKEVFGEKGIHARTAVGLPTLPLNVSVEIDAIIEVE